MFGVPYPTYTPWYHTPPSIITQASASQSEREANIYESLWLFGSADLTPAPRDPLAIPPSPPAGYLRRIARRGPSPRPLPVGYPRETLTGACPHHSCGRSVQDRALPLPPLFPTHGRQGVPGKTPNAWFHASRGCSRPVYLVPASGSRAGGILGDIHVLRRNFACLEDRPSPSGARAE